MNCFRFRENRGYIGQFLQYMKQGIYSLNRNTTFNRDWNNKKQSSFIINIIKRFPISPLYFVENSLGIYLILDGFNRLQTIKNFYENKLVIYSKDGELDGKTFSSILPLYQNRIEDCILTWYIGENLSPDDYTQIFNILNKR